MTLHDLFTPAYRDTARPVFDPPAGAPLFELRTLSPTRAREILDGLLALTPAPMVCGVIVPGDDPPVVYTWFPYQVSEMALSLMGFDEAKKLAGQQQMQAGPRLTSDALGQVLRQPRFS